LPPAAIPTIEDPFAGIPLDPPEPARSAQDEARANPAPAPEGVDDDVDDSPEMATATVPAPAAAAATPAASDTSTARVRAHRGRKAAERTASLTDLMPLATDIVPTEATEGAPNPRDPILFWPFILKSVGAKGYGPSHFSIRVERIGVGVSVTPPTTVAYIDGDEVAGDEITGAGQQLVDYVTHVIHCGRARTSGPARYKLYAYFKNATGSGRMMELFLDHPDEIQAQEQRRAQYLRHARPQGVGAPMPPPLRYNPGPSAYPYGAGHSPYASGAGAAPAAPAAAAQQAVTPLDAIRQYNEAMALLEETRQRILASGAPAPPPLVVAAPAAAPPPPPPPPTPQELQDKQDMEDWRFERRLRSLGYVKPDEMPRPPPATPNQVVAAAADPIEGFEKMLAMVKRVGDMKGTIAEAFGLPTAADTPEAPEPEEPVDAPKIAKLPLAKFRGRDIFIPRETKGVMEFAEQAFMANLETSSELAGLFLGNLAKVLDQTALGKLMAQLLARGGPAAAVVQQAQAQGLVGTGSNGAPTTGNPVLARPKGPMA